MARDVTTDQWFPNVVLTITNDAGQPAEVDTSNGGPVWASSDETAISVHPAEGGMTGAVRFVAGNDDGTPRTARVTITADADRGAGVVPLTFVSEDINVTNGIRNRATGGSVDFGVAEDLP